MGVSGWFKLIKAAIGKDPRLGFLWGVIAILATVALVEASKIAWQALVLGAAGVLVLSVLLAIVFGVHEKNQRRGKRSLDTKVLLALCLLLLSAWTILFTTCTFFDWPKPVGELVGIQTTRQIRVIAKNLPLPSSPEAIASLLIYNKDGRVVGKLEIKGETTVKFREDGVVINTKRPLDHDAVNGIYYVINFVNWGTPITSLDMEMTAFGDTQVVPQSSKSEVQVNGVQFSLGAQPPTLPPTYPSPLQELTAEVGFLSASARIGETVVIEAIVHPATMPPSTGISVTADLTALQLGSSVVLYDDGSASHGDATRGDNRFATKVTIGSGTRPGQTGVRLMIVDAQGRVTTAIATITVAK